MLPPLPHDHIRPFKKQDTTKKEQVAEMFNKISGKYDKLNRVLSGRIDISWRKKAIQKLKEDRPRHILDVATGTGDVAILAYKILQPDEITGIDISEGMLKTGRQKVEKEHLEDKIHLQTGDAEAISFAMNTFDAVIVAFGVRNFENLEKGLTEMLRVLKPGGRLIILEFSRPRNKLIKRIYSLYMSMVAPRVAQWFKQNKEAYQYLNKSATAFPERCLFTDILKKTGYIDTGFTPLSLGICCIYSGRKSL